MDTLPYRLIDEAIEVIFTNVPLLEKKPECPRAFVWRGETYSIVEEMSAWEDYRRRGKMDRNMEPAHLRRAIRVGSWGVGRFYYRVRVSSGQIFEIYYDRAPLNASNRKGNWFILGERKETTSP